MKKKAVKASFQNILKLVHYFRLELWFNTKMLAYVYTQAERNMNP